MLPFKRGYNKYIHLKSKTLIIFDFKRQYYYYTKKQRESSHSIVFIIRRLITILNYLIWKEKILNILKSKCFTVTIFTEINHIIIFASCFKILQSQISHFKKYVSQSFLLFLPFNNIWKASCLLLRSFALLLLFLGDFLFPILNLYTDL